MAICKGIGCGSNGQFPILESGGSGSADSGQRCRTQLYNAIEDCKVNPGPGALAYCDTLSRREDANCSVNRCLALKKYPLGLNTNPADFCLVGIPRAVAPGTSGNARLDNIRSNEAQKDLTAEVPVPTPAPRTAVDWAQEARSDIQQCISSQTQANTCCSQPQKCSGELTDSQKTSLAQLAQSAKNRNDTASLKQLCEQSESMTSSGSNVNTGYANVCYAKHSQCTSTCGEMLSKWQQRSNSCGANCDRQVVSTAVNELQTKSTQCKGYAALENRIRNQSFSTAQNTEMAAICSGQLETTSVSEAPQAQAQQSQNGGGGGGFNASALASGAQAAAAAITQIQQMRQSEPSLCELNPRAPGCYMEVPASRQITSNSGGSAEASSTTPQSQMEITPNGFNVGEDNNLYNQSQTFAAVSPEAKSGATIPNGGGGGFGGSVKPAAEELPSMLGSGENPNTDILKGESGGSGYSQPVHANGSGFENRYQPLSGFSGAPNGQSERQKNYVGMDLKKYLPGQAQDPRRGIAGFGSAHPDIGPMHIDFFQRVSGRLQTLCKLHRLLDCQ